MVSLSLVPSSHPPMMKWTGAIIKSVFGCAESAFMTWEFGIHYYIQALVSVARYPLPEWFEFQSSNP